MRGIDHFRSIISQLLDEKFEGFVSRLETRSKMPSPAHEAVETLTAREVVDKLNLACSSEPLTLQKLRRYCRDTGLRPIGRQRGWRAVFRLSDVIHSQSYAVGETKRKKQRA